LTARAVIVLVRGFLGRRAFIVGVAVLVSGARNARNSLCMRMVPAAPQQRVRQQHGGGHEPQQTLHGGTRDLKNLGRHGPLSAGRAVTLHKVTANGKNGSLQSAGKHWCSVNQLPLGLAGLPEHQVFTFASDPAQLAEARSRASPECIVRGTTVSGGGRPAMKPRTFDIGSQADKRAIRAPPGSNEARPRGVGDPRVVL
jgi:hypothetical protein